MNDATLPESHAHLIVFTTLPDEAIANRIATSLVTQRLAACVQIEGPITSTFRWEDEVQSETEWRCIIKTSTHRYDALAEAVLDIHPYDCPQLVAVPIVEGSSEYLKWIENQLSD